MYKFGMSKSNRDFIKCQIRWGFQEEGKLSFIEHIIYAKRFARTLSFMLSQLTLVYALNYFSCFINGNRFSEDKYSSSKLPSYLVSYLEHLGCGS